MDNIDIVKAYLRGFGHEPGRPIPCRELPTGEFYSGTDGQRGHAWYDRPFKSAFPNLKHSLSNIRMEGNVVKLTVQLSGRNSGHLDLRKMGIGVIPRSQKFIIFPNGDYEFTIRNEKITEERDVSPLSPNRRMSGMLKALGVNMAAL
jgi:hypothetical protein